jgi:DNA (cytosine-5)-methyltransferase 1
MTLGLKRAGFNVLAAVEVDPLAAKTYRLNHPEVVVFRRDIRWLRPKDLMARLNLKRGELELLAGCPPCQGFSSIRTLNGGRGVADPRNDLTNSFSRFVRELQPQQILMENVPGLLDDSRFDRLTKMLSELKYKWRAEVLDVANFGVPQRRRRLVLVAVKDGAIPLPIRAKKSQTVRDAIGDLKTAGASGDPLHDLPERRSRRIANLIAAIPPNGGSRTDLPRRRQLRCHRESNGFKDVYGRMSWDHVSPTITGGCVNPSKGRFLHPEMNRAITAREAALLQSFPGDYIFCLDAGKFRVAEMIGNAIPPEFVRRQAVRLVRQAGS